MSEDEKYYVCLGMKTYGGSFVKGLGQALTSADNNNREVIKTTWPELWQEYLKTGKKLHEEQQKKEVKENE